MKHKIYIGMLALALLSMLVLSGCQLSTPPTKKQCTSNSNCDIDEVCMNRCGWNGETIKCMMDETSTLKSYINPRGTCEKVGCYEQCTQTQLQENPHKGCCPVGKVER